MIGFGGAALEAEPKWGICKMTPPPKVEALGQEHQKSSFFFNLIQFYKE
jgi:hypothetical protein